MSKVPWLPLITLGCAAPAASPSSGPPTTYAFESRFSPGASSVIYGDQTLYHVAIRDLVELAGTLTFRVDEGQPAAGTAARFERLFSQNAKVLWQDPISLSTSPPALQQTYGELSSTAPSLATHAAFDPGADHQDWDTQLIGFSDETPFRHGPVLAPTELIRAIFVTLEKNATDRASGLVRPTPFEGEDLPVHFTEAGVDLARLLDGVLHAQVLFRPAADHFLDEELDSAGGCLRPSGLCSDNTRPLEDSTQTALEGAWDQAFGSFGASTHYGDLSVRSLSRRRFEDRSGDGRIDLSAEYNFGAAVTAALREAGSPVPTELPGRAWEGLLQGRHLISSANGALLSEERDAIRGARDQVVTAWEEVIAATVVHHINDALDILCVCGDEDYAYEDAAFFEHGTTWSALKAHAIALQLNPRSPMRKEDVRALHQLIGDAPVHWRVGVNDDEVEAYRLNLREARALIGQAYGFAAENLGDKTGDGGW